METARQQLPLIPRRNGDYRNWDVRKVDQLRISDTAGQQRMTEKGMLSVGHRGEKEGGG